MNHQTEPVGAADVAAFARDGAVCIRGVLDGHWLAALTNVFDSLKSKGADLSAYYDDPASMSICMKIY